jgi:hypothetical protein
MKYINKAQKEGTEKLIAMGIKTIDDLDAYRAKIDPYNSRYNVLKSIVGDNAAMWIINDLAIMTCTN